MQRLTGPRERTQGQRLTGLVLTVMMVLTACSAPKARVDDATIDAAQRLYELRQRHALALSDTTRWSVQRELSQMAQRFELNIEDAREQRQLWFGGCRQWDVEPLEGDVNTSGDEYAPVVMDDTTMLFTRAGHATTFCATSDVFVANYRTTVTEPRRLKHRRSQSTESREPTVTSGWYAAHVNRPFNDCHESSALSFNPFDSSVLFYGQYYIGMSGFQVGRVMSPSYPSDVAQRQTITYIFDPVTDYQDPRSPPLMTPLIADLSRRQHETNNLATWASSVTDKRGDVYRATVANGELKGFPERLGWPVSGGDFESDAVMTPDGSALFIVSDRPNELYRYEGKEPFTDPDRLHNWGNTNIYVVPIKRTSPMVNKDINDAIRDRIDTGRGLHFVLEAHINTPLAERTPSFSPNGDTMFFSSNGLPGYGGMDVYYVTRLKKDSWLDWSEPKNMGLGLNTAADELWFTRASHANVSDRTASVPTTYFFARRGTDEADDEQGTRGRLDIFTAQRLPVVRYVNIATMCEAVKLTSIRLHRYDGSMRVEEPSGMGFDVGDDVRDFTIVTNDSILPERRFVRCGTTSDTLELTTQHVSVAPCSDKSAIASREGTTLQWQFSAFETESSMLAALEALANHLKRVYNVGRLQLNIGVGPREHHERFTDFRLRLSARHETTLLPPNAQSSVVTIHIDS